MDQIATGRDCDVSLLDDGRVLRRMRRGASTEAEAETMRALADAGYPVPRVFSAVGQDLVMERIEGPSLAEAVFGGALSVSAGGDLLARLHHDLHALAWPGGESLLHMDLHPLNVLMSDDGLARCHGQGNCTEVCPMELEPSGSILKLRRRATLRLLGFGG